MTANVLLILSIRSKIGDFFSGGGIIAASDGTGESIKTVPMVSTAVLSANFFRNHCFFSRLFFMTQVLLPKNADGHDRRFISFLSCQGRNVRMNTLCSAACRLPRGKMSQCK